MSRINHRLSALEEVRKPARDNALHVVMVKTGEDPEEVLAAQFGEHHPPNVVLIRGGDCDL
jgi:hypothetical protein